MEKPLISPDIYCKKRALKSNSNFLLSFRLLQPQRRKALYAFYAFCREVDDLVDSDSIEIGQRTKGLMGWRNEIELTYRDTPTHPVMLALQAHIKKFQIPKIHFHEIVDGMEMDLTIRRYNNFQELYPYCYRVASAVGIVCSYIFGCRSAQAMEYAESLGVAFQLTNILRDVKSDLERDRIYIPADEIIQCGYSETELRQQQFNAAFRKLARIQYNRAVDYYSKAEKLLPTDPKERRAMLPSQLMANYYRSILEKIALTDFQLFGPRVRLSKSYKLLMLAKHWPQFLINRLRREHV